MSAKYGRRSNLYPWEQRACAGCRKRFRTQNPEKRFCSDDCRLKNWRKYNKDKLAVIQKRHRTKQKDDAGVQEN